MGLWSSKRGDSGLLRLAFFVSQDFSIKQYQIVLKPRLNPHDHISEPIESYKSSFIIMNKQHYK
jgi:hypothetical protein